MLSLLSYLYGKVIDLRNALYSSGILEAHELGARTISIGNITTGGTGKTPLVAYVTDLLMERGEKVCILTRGYGREDAKKRVLVSDGVRILEDDAMKAGDEPLELARRSGGKAIVIADANRVAAAEWAMRRFRPTVFVLDDGFQHRKAKRDLDIVCLDATNPFGGGKMLPAGRLREPEHNLSRAAAILITRTELVAADVVPELRTQLSKLAPASEVFESRSAFAGLTPVRDGDEVTAATKVLAFCGLGNPQTFFAMLRAEGYEITGTRTFPDHHAYSQKDLGALVLEARELEADALVTTHKDAVKLMELECDIPLYFAETKLEISGADEFAKLF